MRTIRLALAALALASGAARGDAKMQPPAAGSFTLVRDGRPACTVALAVPARGGAVVKTALDQLNHYLDGASGAALAASASPPESGPALVATAGSPPSWLAGAGFTPSAVGPQGYVIRRLPRQDGDWLVVWGETPLGCRYGIIELLRSLQENPGGTGRTVITALSDARDAPRFPVRVYYFNFAEHLQNAYSVNTAYDVPDYRWTRADWRRFLEMLAAMRYTTFQFWLYPTLFSPEALTAGKGSVWDRFANDMRWVVDRAHGLGLKVEMLQAVNTVGPEWHYHCPNIPAERKEILALWEHWAKRLSNLDILGLFPGDPGGCNRNGCTHETFVDLCLDIVKVTRPHGRFRYDIGTWGTPIWGWGDALRTVPNWDGSHSGVLSGWEGGPDRAARAFAYLLERLPAFPKDTLVSVNMGLNPESDGDGGGGSSRPFVDAIRRTHEVLTWDYAASEGEGAVIPRFRVAKIVGRRRKEATWGYSGGINYTMTPRLNVLQAFAASEAYWDPGRSEGEILDRFSRWVFGTPGVAERVFPYTEVSGDWGGGGWQGSRADLAAHLAEAGRALDLQVPSAAKLPVVPTAEAYRAALAWYVGFLTRLATAAAQIEEVRGATGQARLVDVEKWLTSAQPGPAKDRVAGLAQALRRVDAQGLEDEYYRHTYGIYDSVQSLPDTTVNRGGKKWRPFARQNAAGLFAAFHWDFFAKP